VGKTRPFHPLCQRPRTRVRSRMPVSLLRKVFPSRTQAQRKKAPLLGGLTLLTLVLTTLASLLAHIAVFTPTPASTSSKGRSVRSAAVRARCACTPRRSETRWGFVVEERLI
jgi:hypothetical protein